MSIQMQAADPIASAENLARFGPKLITPLPGPHAQKSVIEDHRLLSPSYTRGYPLVVKRGRGCRIEDVDGNEFLDFTAGIAVNSTGHCHPEVVKAIQEQAAELLHMSGTDFYYDLMPRVAARLSAIAPMPGPHRFYYGNSGAEAIECAMKLARYHTGRQHIISLTAVPNASAGSTTPQTVQGYNMIAWTAEGMTYWAVSDLNLEELQMFARLFRAAPA